MKPSFHKQEAEYEQWLQENPNGFVFNHFDTKEMNKMHHVSCYHLYTSKHSGSRTNYEKVCSDEYDELETEANRLTKVGWSRCKSCEKKGLFP